MVNGAVLFCIEKKRASMFEIPALLFHIVLNQQISSNLSAIA